jgi:hypothetical protein
MPSDITRSGAQGVLNSLNPTGRHQILYAGIIGTFQEHIVIRILSDFRMPCRCHGVTMILDELK